MLLALSMAILSIPVSRDRAVLFLHLHKGAGTFVCNLAYINNMRVNKGHNCLVQKNQRCCGGDSAVDHVRFAQSTRYNFMANEGYLYNAIVPRFFIYVTVLRDSWSRYTSHFRHVCRAYNFPFRKKHFWAWVEGQPDNWNVRHICGTKCMSRAKFDLTPSDYAYTFRRLHMFDHVVRMGSNNTKFIDGVFALCQGLRWSRCPVQKKNAAPQRASDIYSRPSRFDRMTALDDCLFRNLTHSECVGASRYFNATTTFSHPCGIKCTPY